ncbi:zinc finger A20 and AN1 domain-containing stress-associated protein 1-like [Mangifera indica]|uniref:zinc finger A20 and AN1 domain-containing stress-associated protein 1-like n=1 Tax=Mangifera indica TaxID=29780 RepID=UPI001CFB581D|nr:zinc finger A20 and AN1 domain-containing stress-associated protein 1-like [Mangifera indica]
MSSQGNEGGASRLNKCANGCGSLVPEENLNYCENCFQLLLVEEQAAIEAAERAETAFSNETNPGENWVRAQTSTISMKEWISIIRRNERARQMDVLGSSSAVPPPLTVVSGSDQVNEGGEVEEARAVRCPVCRKKVGQMEFRCKCGGVFCIFHRLSEEHECSYDYKGLGRQAIAKANPVIRRDKVKKI